MKLNAPLLPLRQAVMKLQITSFIEHKAAGERFTPRYRRLGVSFVLPGASTSCNGSSCCSSCSW
jgi:hypothetical protein